MTISSSFWSERMDAVIRAKLLARSLIWPWKFILGSYTHLIRVIYYSSIWMLKEYYGDRVFFLPHFDLNTKSSSIKMIIIIFGICSDILKLMHWCMVSLLRAFVPAAKAEEDKKKNNISAKKKPMVRPSKKNTCFSSPSASFFSAASLFFFIIFYEQRFYEQKPTGVTVHTKTM